MKTDGIGVGARLLGRLRLDQTLTAGDGWSLYLADDEERSEFTLVVVAATPAILEERLAEVGSATRRHRLGASFLAEVALEERHLVLYGEALLFAAPPGSRRSGSVASAKPAPTLASGTVFAGRYHVQELLGRGGMGEVYRARDDIFCRAVALKVLSVEGYVTEDVRIAKTRLLEEARFVAGLKHPHIVEIFDAGEADGLPYIVLEACEGGNLRKVIDEDTASDVTRLRWLRQVADALAYAHARGVVHRDIKPENVLLTADGVAKLADFGIAKALSRGPALRVTTGIIGTPRYMAPEQLFGGVIDGRADQFSWALLAEELMSRVHPRSKSAAERDSQRRARGLNPSVRLVVERATRSDPHARYATMEALVADLDADAEGAAGDGRRVFTLKAAAAGVAFALAAAVMASRWLGAAEAPSPPAAGAAEVTRALVEAGPAGALPEAQAAYEAGRQLWRDGAVEAARTKFAAAAEIDARLAGAHVLYIAASEWVDPTVRDHFALARSLRTRLDERDLVLLDAMQPVLEEPPNVEETTRRLDDLVRRYPGDIVVRLVAAQHDLRVRAPRKALARVTAADGAIAHWISARAHLEQDDVESARRELRACIEVSSGAIECLDWLARLEANEGNCEGAEQAARKLVAASHESPDGYAYLARAILHRTSSTEAARAVLERRWALTPASQRDEVRLRDEFFLRAFDGDFDGAIEAADGWEQATLGLADAAHRAFPILSRIELDLEIGKDDHAAAAARGLAIRSSGWLPSEYYSSSIEVARALYFTGQLPRDRFLAERSQAVDEMARRGGYFGAPGTRWYEAFVQTARTAEDARDAVAHEPVERPVIDAVFRDVGVDAELGRVLSMAGDLPRATVALRRATGACAVYKSTSQVRAYADLGDVLRRSGDTAGACAAYAEVTRRWGRESRSATVKRARAGSRMLVCPPDRGPASK